MARSTTVPRVRRGVYSGSRVCVSSGEAAARLHNETLGGGGVIDERELRRASCRKPLLEVGGEEELHVIWLCLEEFLRRAEVRVGTWRRRPPCESRGRQGGEARRGGKEGTRVGREMRQ